MRATVARNATYADDVAIYADAAAKRPNNARVLMNLGSTLARRGEYAAARETLERALLINPDYDDAHYNLGVVYLREGRVADATRHFAAATKSQRDWPQLYATVADLLAQDGHHGPAREMYAKARALAEREGQASLVAEIDAKVAKLPAGVSK